MITTETETSTPALADAYTSLFARHRDACRVVMLAELFCESLEGWCFDDSDVQDLVRVERLRELEEAIAAIK